MNAHNSSRPHGYAICVAEKKSRFPTLWGLLGFNSLLLSILVHLIFIGVATLLVVQVFQTKPVKFVSAPLPKHNNDVEHKVEIAKRNNIESAPPDLKRIIANSIAPITLPDPPVISQSSDGLPPVLSGLDGVAGLSPSGLGEGIGVGNGSGSPFGSFPDNGQNSDGIEGTLYDFTRDSTGQAINLDINGFSSIVNKFVSNSFQPDSPCYTSPNKLFISHLFVPVTADEKAGVAFKSPESSKAFWVVHYHGTINIVSCPFLKQVRFVGFGDNVLVVAINGNIVLDGSDLQYLHRATGVNQKIGGILLPDADNVIKPIFAGDWINLDQGATYKIDILIGDEGGVTTSGLFLETENDEPVTFAENGAPKLPLFSIGPVSDADKSTLSQYLPAECFREAVVVKADEQ